MAFSYKDILKAKKSIDHLISIGRVHLYKPIQIAEILRRYRLKGDIDLEKLETYRVDSRHWRDEVSLRLVGNKSTSSARYQDDLFNENAVPPSDIKVLGELNKDDGCIEAYIYNKCKYKWISIIEVYDYIKNQGIKKFDVEYLFEVFDRKELRSSVDKIYEIISYALFLSLVEYLDVNLHLTINPKKESLVDDFADFIKLVLGLDKLRRKTTFQAAMFRPGVANAADTGMDVVTNFGAMIQIKHISLDKSQINEIASNTPSDKLIIVCKNTDKDILESVFKKIGDYPSNLKAIITINHLKKWYKLCFEKYTSLSQQIINKIIYQFEKEYPHVIEIENFMEERGYYDIENKEIWDLKN